MKLISKDVGSARARAELLAVFAFQGEAPELPPRCKLPPAFAESIKGEFRELKSTDAAQGGQARVVAIGLGKKEDFGSERMRRVSALAAQRAEAMQLASLYIWLPSAIAKTAGGPREAGCAAAEGAWMGSYRFQAHKSKPKASKLAEVVVSGPGKEFAAGVERGLVLARANCFVRDLQNQPGNFMRPRDMAAAAMKLATPSRAITCKVLDEPALKRLGLGALLGVSRGSSEPPRLIHLTYKPRGRSRGTVALIGKGLTFDSGGISIKPAGKMWEMKYDMSGGAAVLGVFHALAELDVPYEVHGIVPTSENMPDASAVKPGDVVRAMNGTTIEVLNTDAEGRLILCDAISYAMAKVQPDTIVDLATLTGAVVVALGHEYSGMFATSDSLRDSLRAAGDDVGERLWPLPLADFHRDWMKGEVADLKNITLGDPGAGSTAGAAFLAHFVGNTEWAHLDIAGTAWGGMNRDYVGGPMGSGVGTRLLMRWLETKR
jgi:leucyl aminopeptidase